MSAPTANAQPRGLPSATTGDRAVPAHARQLAARLSALFQRDVEIVTQLNHAHHRLQEANELLWSGLAPDAFGLIDDGAVAAIGTSQVAALICDGGPAANSQVRARLQNVHWAIHGAFHAYQDACEERRQLAIEVGELSQQLTDALRAAGWSAQQAQQANVHQLARVA
jgi:hypothetical protein